MSPRIRPLTIRVTCTVLELDELRAAAGQAGLDVSEYVRTAAQARARSRPEDVPEPVRVLRDRVRQIDDLVADLHTDLDRVSDAMGIPPEAEH